MSAKFNVKVCAHGHRHRVQKTLFTLLYSELPPTSAQSLLVHGLGGSLNAFNKLHSVAVK